jgi:hypothetical protein
MVPPVKSIETLNGSPVVAVEKIIATSPATMTSPDKMKYHRRFSTSWNISSLHPRIAV